MFTDIVGYSALMSKDEKVALQILTKNRELQKAVLHRFHGEFIKEIGDGTLSIFQSSWNLIRHSQNPMLFWELLSKIMNGIGRVQKLNTRKQLSLIQIILQRITGIICTCISWEG